MPAARSFPWSLLRDQGHAVVQNPPARLLGDRVQLAVGRRDKVGHGRYPFVGRLRLSGRVGNPLVRIGQGRGVTVQLVLVPLGL